MKIFESRGKIKDIKGTRDIAEKIGGIFNGYYSATDMIFKSKKSEGIIDLRIFHINNRSSKNFIVTHKIAMWSDKIKTDRIVIKKDFDTIEESLNFIIDHYGDILKDRYEYSREGWEYNLEKVNIFIEHIEKLGPTIEIEVDNKNDLENLLKLFEVDECFSESVPEIMKKLLGKVDDN